MATSPENCNVCELSDDTTTSPAAHRMGYEEEDDLMVVRKPRMSSAAIIIVVVSVLLIIAAISVAVWCSCGGSGASAPLYVPSGVPLRGHHRGPRQRPRVDHEHARGQRRRGRQ